MLCVCRGSSLDVEAGVKPVSVGQHPSIRDDHTPSPPSARQGRVLHLVPEPMTAAERAHYARKHTTQTSTIGRGNSRALLQLKVLCALSQLSHLSLIPSQLQEEAEMGEMPLERRDSFV